MSIEKEDGRPGWVSETPTWPGAVNRPTGVKRPWHAYEIETEASAPLASVHVLDERVANQLAACLRGEHAAEVEWLRAEVAAMRLPAEVAAIREAWVRSLANAAREKNGEP